MTPRSCACCTASASLTISRDAIGDRQLLRARVVGHRRAGDQLHHEMRRRRAVARMERVDLRDARMLQPAEHLGLVLEPAEDLRDGGSRAGAP